MFVVVFLFSLILGMQAQDAVFKNGVQQGVIKVKFEESMTTTLSQMRVQTRGKTLSTGITNFDQTASTIKAVRMERLIPECPNPTLEAKHRKAGLHLWYVVEFDQSVDAKAAAEAIKKVSGVKTVEIERLKTIAPTKVTLYKPGGPTTFSTLPFNDPSLKDQWHYINTGQLGLTGDRADANLGEAWKVTAGRPDIIVSVHDQGVDVTHEDLKANMWVNPNETSGNGLDDDGNGYIDDINGFNFVKLTGNIDPQDHGTHVAGTIAAVNNNGIGVSGVAGGTGNNDGVKIMSLQILGSGVTSATTGQMFRSYVYAADMGAVISQNSWGYTSPGQYEQDIIDGIDYFIENAGDYPGSPMKGGVVIFASGNDSQDDMFWPGIYEKCIAVSAIGPEWKVASYSNYGTWIEISAPGGDMTPYEMAKAGVLSTLPSNEYGYMDGTSMACPHVSGIAALIIASRSSQITNTELQHALLTSIKDIDKYNPDYIGKLGVGAIDAKLAVRSDKKLAPDQITTLAVKGIAQEFVNLEWKVPADSDDDAPTMFNIYYSTEPLTDANLSKATMLELKNISPAGETISFEIDKLYGTTKYYFGVVSIDRWGNKSVLSNEATGTTNDGPGIDVNTGSGDKNISLAANAAQSAIASKDFKLLNNAEGLLRWEYEVRNTGYEHSWSTFSTRSYPAVLGRPKGLVTRSMKEVESVRSTDIMPLAAFTPIEKKYANIGWNSTVIGDTDPTLPTSGAAKFIVSEEEGFNLTQVQVGLKYTPNTGPVIIEIYEGGLTKDKLRSTEEFVPEYEFLNNYYINLKEHIYFDKGTEFYVVVHVPANNGYSLAIDVELSPEYSDYCFYSGDYGATWITLFDAGVSQNYAWGITAASQSANIDTYITLDPTSGNMSGNSEETISIQADGSTLINGTYNTNVVFKSNDSKNPEYRVPVTFEISGHKPSMVFPKIVDFGSVFRKEETTLDIVLENVGYGRIADLNATTDNPQFTVEQQLYSLEGRSEGKIRVKFNPTDVGNINGKLTVTNGQYTYLISLFGVGAETSKIEIAPVSETKDNLAIGAIIEREVTVKNIGSYPLKYFIPGFDQQGISEDWPADYHSYGYAIYSNNPELGTDNPAVTYQFNDISATGTDITSHFVGNNYKEVPFGFSFPYYNTFQDKIYITKLGFTTFDNSASYLNNPKLKGDVRGYISLYGADVVDLSRAKILYKTESDRMIIQYTDLIREGEDFTGQIVLYANGNIRFYYKEVPQGEWGIRMATVLIEDTDQVDGILLKDWDSELAINDGTVIGFDYPGPDIVTSIENGSGIIPIGESVTVKATMNTSTLSEGTIVRNINIINNDPDHASATFTTTLNITSGGAVDYEVSTDVVDFETIFKDFPYTKEFSIKNNGTKAITVSPTYDNTKFTLTGELTIAPGINQIYELTANTTSVREIEDILKIDFSDGTSKNINLKASVIPAPAMNVDLNEVSANLNLGEQATFPFSIENTGGSDLEVSIVGGQWFSFEESTSTSVKKYRYHVRRENSGEPSYNWVDIVNTGVKVAYDADKENDKNFFWTDVELPFSFPYYGEAHNKIKIGYTGIIALGNGDPAAMPWPTGSIPIDNNPESGFICPLWAPGGFDLYNHPDDAGLYYQTYDDKIIITWLYFFDLTGWGESFQAVIHKDGTIKFIYRLDDGTSDGTGNGVVGFQKAGAEEYTLISSRERLPLGMGLAYVIAPDDVKLVSPNEKIEGTLKLDASNIYGGEFSDNMIIKSNDLTNLEVLKPVKVTVAGEATIEAPTEISLGDCEVVFDDLTWSYNYMMKPLVIKNTGTAPFRITGARMETGGKYLTQLIFVAGMWGSTWTPIEDLWGGYPEQFILPGASFNSYVRFAPEETGSYEDVLILESSLGEIKVKLSGLGYKPPVINVDDTPINVSFNTPDQTENHSFKFDNKGGGYKLDYNVLVKYKRGLETQTLSRERMVTSIKNVNITDTVKALQASSNVTRSASPYNTFNKILQYLDDSNFNVTMGNDAKSRTILAIRYTADKDGLNLSDIGSIVNLRKADNGVMDIEIRAGGDNITNALPLTKESFNLAFPEDATGSDINVWATFALRKSVQILPNEEFYVIFSYPIEFHFPQGMQVGGVEVTSNRYLWFYDGEWMDLQNYLPMYQGTSGESGFISYVAERNYNESGWLKIITPDTGILQPEEESEVQIKFVGSFAESGDQKASVMIRSNDVNASVVEVPVSLHMNEAPVFTDVPASIMTAEKEVTELTVVIKDKEGHTFTSEVLEKPEFVTATASNDNILLSIAPDYGHAGNYKVSMKAVDQYNAESEYTIDINVAKTNRAPEFIGSTTMRYNIGATPARVNINDLFSDPDGDEFTFTIASQNTNIVEAYQSGSEYFMVEPRAAGETKLTIVATDVRNGSTTQEITVVVESCVNPDGLIVQKWNDALVVNNVEGKYIAYQWYKNGNPVAGETKQYFGEKDGELDFDAQYFVQLTTANGETILTCPMTPERKDISLKAYPNPVKAGQPVRLEANLPDLNTNPLTIQVISVSGRVTKTLTSKEVENMIEMPYESGSYFIRVTSNQVTKTFSIIVQ